MRTLGIVLALATVLVMGGCGENDKPDGQGASDTAATSSEPEDESVTYRKIGDLIEDLKTAGVLKCTAWTLDTDDEAALGEDQSLSPLLLGAAESATCYENDSDDSPSSRAAIFASTESRDSAQDMVSANDAEGDPVFVGKNFIVVSPRADALVGELDGEIVESEFDVG